MAQTPEGKVKDEVKALLNKFSAHHFWPVQTGYGAPTLDCLGCHNGRYFAVETKAPGKKLTPRQQLTRSDIEAAGGKVFVVGERQLVNPGNRKVIYSGIEELELWLLSSTLAGPL